MSRNVLRASVSAKLARYKLVYYYYYYYYYEGYQRVPDLHYIASVRGRCELFSSHGATVAVDEYLAHRLTVSHSLYPNAAFSPLTLWPSPGMQMKFMS